MCITGCSCFCFPRYGKNTGSFHGSVFSYEDQQKIKDEVERKYYNNKYSANSDRILISNAPEDDTIYPTEIYRRMSSNGIPNEEYQKIVKKINDILWKLSKF